MTLGSSKLLESLESSIQMERDGSRADCLRAEYVAQLARRGRMAQANSILADLRARYERRPHGVVTPWINFADAICEMQLGHDRESADKLRRAHALSQATSLRDLQALTAAWMAHLCWNEQDADRAVSLADEALRYAHRNNDSARCRVNLVIGEMFALSRRVNLSHAWFIRARNHATRIGDEASLSALAFNLSAIHLMTYRQQVLSYRTGETVKSSGLTSNETSKSLDLILGLPTDSRTNVHRAQLLSLEGQPVLAIKFFELAGQEEQPSSAPRQRAAWLSDEAWCHARIGNSARAREIAEAAEVNTVAGMQLDDRAAMHARLGLVFEIIGIQDKATWHSDQARKRWTEYAVFQERCAKLCQRFAEAGLV